MAVLVILKHWLLPTVAEKEYPLVVEYLNEYANHILINHPHGNSRTGEEFNPTDKCAMREAKRQLTDGVPVRRVYRNVPDLRNKRQLSN